MEFQVTHARISIHTFHGIGGGISSVFQVIHKSKDKKMQLNLANFVLTVTVIFHTFSVTSLHVNHVLDIGLTRPSKFPTNLRNEVRSTMGIGVYVSAHRRILLSLNCNRLRDLGSYGFPECANACIIPFGEVVVLFIMNSFQTVPL